MTTNAAAASFEFLGPSFLPPDDQKNCQRREISEDDADLVAQEILESTARQQQRLLEFVLQQRAEHERHPPPASRNQGAMTIGNRREGSGPLRAFSVSPSGYKRTYQACRKRVRFWAKSRRVSPFLPRDVQISWGRPPPPPLQQWPCQGCGQRRR